MSEQYIITFELVNGAIVHYGPFASRSAALAWEDRHSDAAPGASAWVVALRAAVDEHTPITSE